MRVALGTFWLLVCLLASPVRAAEPERTELSLTVRGKPTSALLLRPAEARALVVLSHGQVMTLDHPFMESMAKALADQRVASLRFNYPYAQEKKAGPDPMPVLIDATAAAVNEGQKRAGELPLLLGGKSAGALVSIASVLNSRLPAVKGVVVLGFPLHPPNRPSAINARILDGLKLPMLFVEGSRDPLADLSLMRAIVEKQGPQARIVVIDDADHNFELPEGSARPAASVFDQIASAVASFAATLAPKPGG
jgi:predicted alpha/beta-hydrolase family hydrolase